MHELLSSILQQKENKTVTVDYNTNYFEIIPYTLADEGHDIETAYPVYCKGASSIEQLKYDKKAQFIGVENSNLTKILQTIHKCPLTSCEQLVELSQKLNFEFTLVGKNFTKNYCSFKTKFQKHFNIFFAFVEGLHRSTMFAKLAENVPFTNILDDTSKKNIFEHNKILEAEYYVRIHLFPTEKLPSIESLKERSYHIRKTQNIGFKCTYVDVISECRNFFNMKENDLKSLDETWITVTKWGNDPYVLNRNFLLQNYLKILLQKGPIADKHLGLTEAKINGYVKALGKHEKYAFQICPSSILSKSNPGKSYPRDAKIFLDLLSFASTSKDLMNKFHYMLQGMTPELQQNDTIHTSTNLKDLNFYENMLWCIRTSSEFLYQHHIWYMEKLSQGTYIIVCSKFATYVSRMIFIAAP